MYVLRVLVVVAILTSACFATAQMRNLIQYQGIEYYLHSSPITYYFEEHPDKEPKPDFILTSCWLGYKSAYEIKNDSLFLTDITKWRIRITNEGTDSAETIIYSASVLDSVFPAKEVTHIDWITGLYEASYGKIIKYVHSAYETIFSNYILFEFKNGILTDVRWFDHKSYKRFKKRQYKAEKE